MQMLSARESGNVRGVVHRSDMIDAQSCILPWLVEASMVSMREMLNLQRQIADRQGTTIEIVMRASQETLGWQQLRRRLVRECLKEVDVMVKVTAPASLTITITPDPVMDIEDGYVMVP
jgi:hypothetical protein